MEIEIETPKVNAADPVKHRLAKLVLGTAGGFLGTLVAEKVYDAVMERMKKTPEIDPK